MYQTKYKIVYKDPRTGKTVTVPKGYWTNGADFAIDIQSEAWNTGDTMM